jgi:hypothetical protein
MDAHEKRNSYTILAVKHERKRLPEHLGIDGRMPLKWSLSGRVVRTGLIWLRIGTSGSLL